MDEHQKAKFVRRIGGRRPYQRVGKIAAGSTAVAGVYYVAHLEQTPITKRYRFCTVSADESKKKAAAAYKRILEEFQDEDKVVSEHSATHKRVMAIATRLIKAAEHEPALERTLSNLQLDWVVHVIQSSKVNAFVLPGGQIFVYTGLIDFIGKEDDGLAMVLGHEMTHALLRHGAEQATLKTIFYSVETLILGAIWFMIPSDIIAYLLHKTETYLFQAVTELPYSRKLETEADAVGLQIASWACYNPEAAPLVWEMMDNYAKAMGTDSSNLRYFSTHPTHETRVEDLTKQLDHAWEEISWRCPTTKFIKDVRPAMEAAQKQRMEGIASQYRAQVAELEDNIHKVEINKKRAKQQQNEEKVQSYEQKLRKYRQRLKTIKEKQQAPGLPTQ